VNPNIGEILGKKSYPNVKAVKEEIDLAVISTPRETTIHILEDCVAANVKSVIVINQGFNDADSRGKAIQREMTEIVKRDGIRILGPNTLGVLNCFNDFTTSFMPVKKVRSPVGVICQTGIHLVGQKTLVGKVGKGIDIGNACDIGFCDALEYLGEDPDINIIAIHMEGMKQENGFLSLAGRVVKEKPIVIHKTGSSETGARAALSHSGSMAGNYQVYKAALKQAGVTFLEEGGRMSHAVKTLLNLPVMRGNRVGIITYTGGAGIMCCDGLERYGLKLTSFSPETIHQLAELSPDWLPLGNPLDVWPAVMVHGAHKAYSVALRAVLNDRNVDAIICIAIAPLPEDSFLDISDALIDVVNEFPPHKPVMAWFYGPNTEKVSEKVESGKRVMVYPTLDITAWALSLLRDRYKVIG